MTLSALKPRAELEQDSLALDPYCKLYLPLWKLDGDSFADRSAYGHLCTNHGSLWTPQGWSFDGVDDYVDLPDLNLHSLNSLTIETWVKGNSGAGQPAIIAFGDGTGAGQWSLTLTTYQNKFRFGLESGTIDYNLWGIQTLNIGTGYYLVAVKDETVIRTYINSVQDDSSSAPSTTNDVTNHRIGGMYSTDPNLFWDGLIAEVLIYSRALTPQEILDHYIIRKEMFGKEMFG